MQIRVDDLAKRFGPVTALHDLRFETGSDWRCLGILGRNGAGKTTFLRILVGLLEASAGRIELTVNSNTWEFADPRVAAFVSEQNLLVPAVTGKQHLSLYKELNGIAGVQVDGDCLKDLIQRFDLQTELDKTVATMSKGTKRKLEIAAAISSSVPLVIADELTDGLDIPSRLSLENFIRDLDPSFKRFLVSSHDLSFITSVCDSVVIIDHGRCVDAFLVPGDAMSMKQRVAAAFESLPDEHAQTNQ